jgi:hypothetical protein
MPVLPYEDGEIVVTARKGGWHVRYRGRDVSGAHLDHALAEAVGIDTHQAGSFATRLLDEHLKAEADADGSA